MNLYDIELKEREEIVKDKMRWLDFHARHGQYTEYYKLIEDIHVHTREMLWRLQELREADRKAAKAVLNSESQPVASSG